MEIASKPADLAQETAAILDKLGVDETLYAGGVAASTSC